MEWSRNGFSTPSKMGVSTPSTTASVVNVGILVLCVCVCSCVCVSVRVEVSNL